MHSLRPKQLPPEFCTSGTTERSLPLLAQRGLLAVGHPPHAAPDEAGGGEALRAAEPRVSAAPGPQEALAGGEFSPPD